MKLYRLIFFFALALAVTACSDDNYSPTDDTQTTDDTTGGGDPDPTDDTTGGGDPDPDPDPIDFTDKLSELPVFQGNLSDLTPRDGVYLYELNSGLFTDYAAKQRLIRLPNGQAMEYAGDDQLPDFPDNTLIAKTFYYNIDDRDPSLGTQIIETRILLKLAGEWLAADYLWNDEQTEAFYDEDGGEVPISYIDSNGVTRNVDYLIPSRSECIVCHFNNAITTPIGPKLRSMNFNPNNEYVNINQLQYFMNEGILTFAPDPASLPLLPDWEDDAAYTLEERARAYMDINCAHCHNPDGVVGTFDMDFRYETAFDDSGIYANRGEIEARTLSTLVNYRMPQLGRTVVHEEAVTMLVEYLESLD